MKVPLSWLRDYVDIQLPLEEIARILTMLGLEVDEIRVVGLPIPAGPEDGGKREFKVTGLDWDPERIVVAQIDEVMPHPNADRLVLCRLQDGQQEHVVLTGAPNLYPYKGQGPLTQPIKVAYAKEGARIYDGHQPGQVLTTLKRAKIRGVESYSMVCSEKELGISEEHEGVIFLDPDAPTGMPLVDYMGDAVYEISILPNMIRNACIVGVARELAAATGLPMRHPDLNYPTQGKSIEGKARIEIREPELNPRFVVGLIENVKIAPSPYLVQRRLRLAGMRPISNIVDATNYVMLEIGQPLHAFDYDKLAARTKGTPTIITRSADPGERLTTLDGADRPLDPFTVLVCDEAGALSIAGVMGGAETEVTDETRTILLEGAAWNFINIRKTVQSQKLQSEAAYRFSRGIHPALAEVGVRRGLRAMEAWSGGQVYEGLVDNYPLPQVDPVVEITPADVTRMLGIEISAGQIVEILRRLEFQVSQSGSGETTVIRAQTPPHRTDIGEGVVGMADLVEEIARLYGYDRIPATRLADSLPPQRSNPVVEGEERLKDILTNLGLQEVINYRLTTPEREARLYPAGEAPANPDYIRLLNPINPDRVVMRRSQLASVLDILERNVRLRQHVALFEIGKIFLPQSGQVLPCEPRRLSLAITGLRHNTAWDVPSSPSLDFFDLKGIVEALLGELHYEAVRYEPAEDEPTFHPGKCARVFVGEVPVGVMGELHPLVKENYDFGDSPVLAGDFDLDLLMQLQPKRYVIEGVPTFPPVLEDIAVVVDEDLPAAQVEAAIHEGGGKLLADVRLFDIFRGEQIGAGKKSLAYSLTYQAPDRTLNDKEAAQIRQRIIKRLEQSVGAKLRS